MARGINFEILSALDSNDSKGLNHEDRTWLFVCLMVLRGYKFIQGVAICKDSWNLFNSGKFASESRDFYFIDTYLRIFESELKGFSSKSISEINDLKWIAGVFSKAEQLAASNTNLYYALQALYDSRFQVDLRAGLSRVWSGIEALLGSKGETVFKVSLLICLILKENPNDRKTFFKEVKKIYDKRSKAVHGSETGDLEYAYFKSWDILAALISVMIEKNKVYNDSELEDLIIMKSV